MYEQFYGLKEKPFHIVPNPNFLYLSSKHQNALTYLEYGLTEGAGFILLTGEIGTGKTTLIRHILNDIERHIDVAVIFNTNVNADQLINLILHEFEVKSSTDDKAKKLDDLYQFLIKRYAAGRKALLIIDEAQNLSPEVLEEVRMLTNLQSDDQMLLQIMLVGQPELKDKLKSPGLIQFSQRITVNYHLTALSREDTSNYISTRLARAGCEKEIFTRKAIDMIHEKSKGVPRTINLLCDSALVYGFADELENIDVEVISQVVEDKGGIGLDAGMEAAADEIFIESRDIHETVAAGNIPTVMDRRRLQAMEDKITKLQMQMDWQLDELEKRAASFKDEVVTSIQKQLNLERGKSDFLLQENARLKLKCDFLRRKFDKMRHQDREAGVPKQTEEETIEENMVEENEPPRKISFFRKLVG